MNKAPIHVMHIIDGLEFGGAEIILIDLIEGLLSHGFKVSVLYFQPGPLIDRYSKLGISLTHIPWSARVDPILLMRMCRVIRRACPHIIHTHLFKSNFHGQLAARLCGVPVAVSTMHSNNEWVRKPEFGFVYGLVMRLADKIIALSDEMREYFIYNSHIPSSQVMVISNAIPIKRFENNDDAGRALRAEFDIPAQSPLFGFIARLDPPKDHATFLHSAVEILRKHNDARFLIAGDGVLRQSLMELSAQLGLEKAVIFCGFRIDVPAIHSALDVLVLSSRFEGVPMVLLEAMAAGRPVVATDVRGISSVVVNDENGILVPFGESHALAEACLRLVNDSSLRQRLVQAGYASVKANYSMDVMTGKTIGLYHSLLKRHNITYEPSN